MLSFFHLLASGGISITANEINYTGTTSDSEVLKNLLNTAYTWAGVIAVIILIVAGYFYVVSGDDPNRITRAKNAILGAAIGLTIIFLAFVITNAVIAGVTQ